MKSNSNQKKKLEEFSNFKLINAKAVLGGLGDTPPEGGGKDGDIDPPSTNGASGPRRPQ